MKPQKVIKRVESSPNVQNVEAAVASLDKCTRPYLLIIPVSEFQCMIYSNLGCSQNVGLMKDFIATKLEDQLIEHINLNYDV